MNQTQLGAERAADRSARIDVPDPPTLPGFQFRLYRGPSDHPGMIRANNAARQAAGVVEPVTVDGMDNEYANLSNSDPYRDVIVCEAAGSIVAYGRIEWGDNSDGARDYTSFCLVEPSVRRRGVGRAMLGWQEARIYQIATGQTTDRPRFYFAFVYDRDAGSHALLESAGYAAIRRGAEMVRPNLDDIPEVAVPAGLDLRPGSADQARAVWDADVEIFRDHWGSVDESAAGFAKFVNHPRFDPSTWVVAWDGQEIAGLVFASVHEPGPDGEILGYLDSVGVRRQWRRRGLGRAIVAEALRVLRDRGATTVGLGVDLESQNAAARLYESVGFKVETTSTEYRKRLEL